MSIKAILFDLDGTLLPMNQETFTKAYFKELVKKLLPFGSDADTIVAGVWAGTKAMVMNDGAAKNSEVFWKVFADTLKIDISEMMAASDDFYTNEFKSVRASVGENPLAVEAIKAAAQNGRKVVLSTNPLFPMTAQKERLAWIGLTGDEFCLITSYETDSYCKPNPKYFLSVCERIGVEPHECLLIGNDENEDMYAGSKAGLNTYLVIDSKIASAEHPHTGDMGTFEEMIDMLRSI